MNEKYEPQMIEPALQTQWQADGAYVAPDIARENDARFPQGKFYACSMLPYPSGKLHMGHVRNYTLNDVLYRYKRMRGFNVLMPMGWDAFGLPAENAAMKNGIAPAAWTYENIRVMKAQCQSLGLAIDWSRELTTCDPNYYKWNQWLFIKMLEQGIAYRKTQIVNWDPVDQTVLANEQVVDGRGWRSGAPVEKREIPGYYFKITEYAEELLDCTLNQLPGWSERVRLIQENWIGKSFGVNFGFPYDLTSLPPLQGEGGGGDGRNASAHETHPRPNPPLEGEGTQDEPPLEGEGKDQAGNKFPVKGLLRVYTTRADTLMGVTFVAIAAEHPLATRLAQGKPELQAFIEKCKRGSVMEADVATMEKEGVATGFFVAHPISGEKIEVWVGNYVLMGYGEGAVMAVPAHDERDFAFAKKYNLPIKQVISVPGETFSTDAWREWYADKQRGTCIHSGKYDGLAYDAAVDAIAADLKAKNLGDKQVQFRLRDWGISRQRYWGTPIPIIHCDSCGPVPVPEKDLPVVLPEDLVPDGSGNPLNKCEAFLKCSCPQCGKPARRETDTMDTFVDSSWYYMRYCSPGAASMVDARNDYWMPMDQYIGGIEHAVLHLLYARFWTKVMRDLGLLKFDEPFLRLMNQGFLLNHIFYKRNDKGGKDFFPPQDVTVTHDAAGHINGGTLADGSRVEYGGVGKMGKTERNGVDPQALIDQYGADTARLFVMFVGGPEDSAVWSDTAVEGAQRYLRRVWTWCAQHREAITNCNADFPPLQGASGLAGPDRSMGEPHAARNPHLAPNPSPEGRGALEEKNSLPPSPPGRGIEGEGKTPPQHLSSLASEGLSTALKTVRFEVHAALKQANFDYERMQYNTVVSAAMKMLNALESVRHDGSTASASVLREGASILLRTLYPIAPHIGVRLWDALGFAQTHGSLLDAPWPEPDAAALVRDEIEIGVQVNGKLRASIRIPAQANEEAIRALALADENVAKFVEGKPLKFFKVIPGKLVSMAV